MADSFLLTVPVAPEYRVLAPEVAARYAELAGGTADDGGRLAADLTRALEALARDAPADAAVALSFTASPDEVVIDLRCGARTASVHRAVVAPR
jgi:hypothetical protein